MSVRCVDPCLEAARIVLQVHHRLMQLPLEYRMDPAESPAFRGDVARSDIVASAASELASASGDSSPLISVSQLGSNSDGSQMQDAQFQAVENVMEQIPCVATRDTMRFLVVLGRHQNRQMDRLLHHLGVSHNRGSTVSAGSGTDSSLSGNASQGSGMTGRPHCPVCGSSAMKSEKNLVQHLGKALKRIDRPEMDDNPCRLQEEKHRALVAGMDIKQSFADRGRSMLQGYQRQFVSSHTDGFDPGRSGAAFMYLESCRTVAPLPHFDAENVSRGHVNH